MGRIGFPDHFVDFVHSVKRYEKKIVAANWKMNMTQGESERFVESFLRDVGEITDVEVVIIPPFTAIAKVSEALGRAQNIKVGAQNMYWEKSGPFTGEISAPLLRDLFVHYVVLGHSERRTLFGETDEMVNRKVRAAHRRKAASDCLRRRNARAARQRQCGKNFVDPIARQSRRSDAEGIAGNRDRLRTGVGDRYRAQRHTRSKHRKRTRSFVTSCAKCPTTRQPTESGFSTAAA